MRVDIVAPYCRVSIQTKFRLRNDHGSGAAVMGEIGRIRLAYPMQPGATIDP